MNQQKDIIRDARVLGTPKMLLLGLQHMFAMFGATILVPILVNSYFQNYFLFRQYILNLAENIMVSIFHHVQEEPVFSFQQASVGS